MLTKMASNSYRRFVIVILGSLSISAMTSAIPEEGTLTTASDDFTFSPPSHHRYHHRTHNIHHNHNHHHHHHSHHHNPSPSFSSNNNLNNNDENGVDGRRRDSENESHHFPNHQHQQYSQHHHQLEQEDEQQRMEMSHQNSDSDEHLHQEDSPYYGKYTNTNKYDHNHDHVNCRLPEAWSGRWFQSGFPNAVLIDNKSIEGKGTCYESSGDKFLFVEKGHCHRCVVINQRHHNVLEYKESPYCPEKNSLDNLCSQIPGDATLFSLFRVDAQPIICPFKGPYTFTYNKGLGLCKSPVSNVDTCTETSRLLLRYNACPDVMKTESLVEELQCLAQWKDSTYHYLVGKLNYQLAASNEDRYRCFVYEIIRDGAIVKIAVSGDATCNGLSSPIEGAKTLTFTKVNEGGGVKCKFPNWVSSHHWHSLDGKVSVKTNHKNSTMHIADTSPQDASSSSFTSSSSSGGYLYHPGRGGGVGGVIYNSGNFGNLLASSGNVNPYFLFSGGTRITCQAVKELSEDHVAIVAQHTEGCTSTTVCINFYKRHSHVIELQIGKKGYDDYDCGKSDALGPNLPYVTLIRAEPNSHRCPYLGKYMASGLVAGGDLCLSGGGIQNIQAAQHGAFHSVVVGCGQRATMDFHSKCLTQEPITSYECHGSWEDNGTGYLIASPLSRSSTSARRFCFTYLETDEGLSFFSSSETCRRDVSPNVEGIWAFNLTVDGQCAEPMTSGAHSSTHCDVLSPYFLATLLVLLTLGCSDFQGIAAVGLVSNNNNTIVVRLSDLFYSLFAKILHSFSTQRISSRLLTSPNQHQHYHYHSSMSTSSRRMGLA